MSEEVGIILREAVPDDAKDILLMMGQVNKETEFLVLMKQNSCYHQKP